MIALALVLSAHAATPCGEKLSCSGADTSRLELAESWTGFVNDDPRYPVIVGMVAESGVRASGEVEVDCAALGFTEVSGLNYEILSLALTFDASGGVEGTATSYGLHGSGTVCGLEIAGSETTVVTGSSDYNVHDPGITMLELFFALPEVGDEFYDKGNKAAGTSVSLVLEPELD